MRELPRPGTRLPNPQEGFETGQPVRPVPELQVLRPRLTMLTVRRSRKGHGYCSGCKQLLEDAGRNRTWEDSTVVRPGEMYAATQEVSCWLCLNCVEGVSG